VDCVRDYRRNRLLGAKSSLEFQQANRHRTRARAEAEAEVLQDSKMGASVCDNEMIGYPALRRIKMLHSAQEKRVIEFINSNCCLYWVGLMQGTGSGKAFCFIRVET